MEIKELIAEASAKKNMHELTGLLLLLLLLLLFCATLFVFIAALLILYYFSDLHYQEIDGWMFVHRGYLTAGFVSLYLSLLFLSRGNRSSREKSAMINYLMSLQYDGEKKIPELASALLEPGDSQEVEAYKIEKLKEKLKENLLIKSAIEELEKS